MLAFWEVDGMWCFSLLFIKGVSVTWWKHHKSTLCNKRLLCKCIWKLQKPLRIWLWEVLWISILMWCMFYSDAFDTAFVLYVIMMALLIYAMTKEKKQISLSVCIHNSLSLIQFKLSNLSISSIRTGTLPKRK